MDRVLEAIPKLSLEDKGRVLREILYFAIEDEFVKLLREVRS